MNLRDYQDKAVDLTFSEWEIVNSTLLVMPTGCGKTIVFASIINRMSKLGSCMVVAHRKELIHQAADKIERVTGIKPMIEMGEDKIDMNRMDDANYPKVIVASVQTLTAGGDGSGRLNKFDPEKFSCLILDEAHRAIGDSFVRVIEWFKSNPALKILGVTATPDRTDEEALGKVFESVAFDYEISDAINDGWLVPVKIHMVPVKSLDYSSVRTIAGELNSSDVAKIVEEEENLHKVAHPTVELSGDKRTLVFAASVKQAERLCEIINRYKPGKAGWVCGKTNDDERDVLLGDFASGKLQYMVNVGVLTEGYDNQGIEMVVMGRPTKSRSLYSQCIGRATRTLPNVVDGIDLPEDRRAAIAASAKPFCAVLDFVGNAGRHKLIHAGDVLGGNFSEEVVEEVHRKAAERGVLVDVTEEMVKERELQRTRKKAEEYRRSQIKLTATYSVSSVDPFNVFGIEPQRERGWDTSKKLSEKQTALLIKNGIDPSVLTYHQSRQVLFELFRRWDAKLCSFKQAKALTKFGYNTKNMTFDQASKLMNRLAANGWRKVPEYEGVAA